MCLSSFACSFPWGRWSLIVYASGCSFRQVSKVFCPNLVLLIGTYFWSICDALALNLTSISSSLFWSLWISFFLAELLRVWRTVSGSRNRASFDTFRSWRMEPNVSANGPHSKASCRKAFSSEDISGRTGLSLASSQRLLMSVMTTSSSWCSSIPDKRV